MGGKICQLISNNANTLIISTYILTLQNNDPALTSLTVGVDLHFYEMSETDGFVPHENDWGKLGRFIGRNTHITEVSVYLELHYFICFTF
jgi:hypothetical protein